MTRADKFKRVEWRILDTGNESRRNNARRNIKVRRSSSS